MKVGISIKIDVTKIDKSRLFKGEKGTYLDLTTFVELDEQDKFGNNGFIAQSQTKEEREAKVKPPEILGNCKVFYKGATEEQHKQGMATARAASEPVKDFAGFDDMESDIPF